MNENDTAQAEKKYSVEEYQNLERRNVMKNDFFDGRVLAGANANRTANLIATNTTIAVGSRVQGQKCEIYTNAMRVRLSLKHITYPNVVVVSGAPSFADNTSDTLVNPTVAFDIYSKNTSFQDKTEKLESYLALDSIREYLLVKEDEMRIEHYSKQNPKQWVYRIYDSRDDIVSIDSINCKISLAEVYAQVKFLQTDVKSQAVN